MSEYTDVVAIEALQEGVMIRVDVRGTAVLLARVGDAIHAVQARCPHFGADLSRGTLEGSIVRCPLHGSQFDLTDGHVVKWAEQLPSLARKMSDAVRPEQPLGVFDVKVEDGRVLVGPERRRVTP